MSQQNLKASSFHFLNGHLYPTGFGKHTINKFKKNYFKNSIFLNM